MYVMRLFVCSSDSAFLRNCIENQFVFQKSLTALVIRIFCTRLPQLLAAPTLPLYDPKATATTPSSANCSVRSFSKQHILCVAYIIHQRIQIFPYSPMVKKLLLNNSTTLLELMEKVMFVAVAFNALKILKGFQILSKQLKNNVSQNLSFAYENRA